MPAIASLPDANVRSSSYYVARTRVRCPYCGLSTRLLALAMPQGHETLQVDDDSEADSRADAGAGADAGVDTHGRDDPGPAVWQRENANALLFYVESLPGVVQDRLQYLSPFYRLGFDAGTKNSYWANHCEHCAALLGDHELHCEPEGAFLPASETAATHIRLLEISEPFAAAAAGYACDPEFFAFMRKD